MNASLVTCEACRGDCCTGMVLQIPTPRTHRDFEDIRWYLYHEKTHVYIDHRGDWFAEIDVACQHRNPSGGNCRLYADRPPMCREGTLRECEMNFEDAKVRFVTLADFERWRAQRKQGGK